ncbi:MAG: hypothetical protein H7Y36_12355 [Armatimonadetes bacterium]|nr:hypothetical protein [Akkermansiaceae bacterium]
MPAKKKKLLALPLPQWRRLRGYAFDPGLSQQFATAEINEIVFRLPWDPDLRPGPVGEYIEVIDHDPASGCFYDPVDLNDPSLIASDGLLPDEGNPKFHQQFVYAVAMTTIGNFERALGRRVIWSRYNEKEATNERDEFIHRLRIYPHAFRGANAYYSPEKRALLFGYFPAVAVAKGAQLPGGIVFTCLSHDIIAHETTHALLDTILPKYLQATNPDVLAFHEALADIVALFQHFTFPAVLRHQISKTRGDLASQSLLGELAQQFGQATGLYGGLRDAIGKLDDATGAWKPRVPDPSDYESSPEPHARGAVLVAAVFDAFLAIYRSRIADLIRIATGGSGVLPAGALPPDLVNRLTQEASKTAEHILGMCIRALDYCPPVDLTFGDYLRAIITADMDLVPEDTRHYRVAVIEAFRKRGIYPRQLRTFSENSLRWATGSELDLSAVEAIQYLTEQLRPVLKSTEFRPTRFETFQTWRTFQIKVHGILSGKIDGQRLGNLEKITGLALSSASKISNLRKGSNGRPSFQVHAVRPVRRRGPDGGEVNQVVLAITQRRILKIGGHELSFTGGASLILDLDTLELRYAIIKPIGSAERFKVFMDWITGNPTVIALAGSEEAIARLHLHT